MRLYKEADLGNFVKPVLSFFGDRMSRFTWILIKLTTTWAPSKLIKTQDIQTGKLIVRKLWLAARLSIARNRRVRLWYLIVYIRVLSCVAALPWGFLVCLFLFCSFFVMLVLAVPTSVIFIVFTCVLIMVVLIAFTTAPLFVQLLALLCLSPDMQHWGVCVCVGTLCNFPNMSHINWIFNEQSQVVKALN